MRTTWKKARNRLRRALRYALKRAWAPFALAGVDAVGPGARVRGTPMVENDGRIVIGSRFACDTYLAKVQLYTGEAGELAIGDDCFVNNGSTLSASCSIRVGNRVNIAPHCTVIDNDFHGVAERDTAPAMAPIVLEDDVWLGTGVIVLKGVTIGRGSVIASGSVVTRDVPPGVLAGGVPAKVLKAIAPGPLTA